MTTQKVRKRSHVHQETAKFNKTDCILECFYDKEIGACGSCYRTLDEIAEAGKAKKEKINERI